MKIFNKEELPYIKYPIIFGSLFGLLSFFAKMFLPYGNVRFVKTGLGFYMDFTSMIITELVFVILWGLVVYLTLVKVNKIIPDLLEKYKYSVALYLLLSFEIVAIALSLIFFKKIGLGIGILPIAITFIIPALYKPRNKKDKEEKNG